MLYVEKILLSFDATLINSEKWEAGIILLHAVTGVIC